MRLSTTTAHKLAAMQTCFPVLCPMPTMPTCHDKLVAISSRHVLMKIWLS